MSQLTKLLKEVDQLITSSEKFDIIIPTILPEEILSEEESEIFFENPEINEVISLWTLSPPSSPPSTSIELNNFKIIKTIEKNDIKSFDMLLYNEFSDLIKSISTSSIILNCKTLYKKRNQVDPLTNQPRYGPQSIQKINMIVLKLKKLIDNLIIKSKNLNDNLLKIYDEYNFLILENEKLKKEKLEYENNLLKEEEEKKKLEEENLIKQKKLEEELLKQKNIQANIIRNQIDNEKKNIKEYELLIYKLLYNFLSVLNLLSKQINENHLKNPSDTSSSSSSSSSSTTINEASSSLFFFISSLNYFKDINYDKKLKLSSLIFLQNLIERIISNPDDNLIKKLRLSHPTILSKLSLISGSFFLLASIGFEFKLISNEIEIKEDDYPSFINQKNKNLYEKFFDFNFDLMNDTINQLKTFINLSSSTSSNITSSSNSISLNTIFEQFKHENFIYFFQNLSLLLPPSTSFDIHAFLNEPNIANSTSAADQLLEKISSNPSGFNYDDFDYLALLNDDSSNNSKAWEVWYNHLKLVNKELQDEIKELKRY